MTNKILKFIQVDKSQSFDKHLFTRLQVWVDKSQDNILQYVISISKNIFISRCKDNYPTIVKPLIEVFLFPSGGQGLQHSSMHHQRASRFAFPLPVALVFLNIRTTSCLGCHYQRARRESRCLRFSQLFRLGFQSSRDAVQADGGASSSTWSFGRQSSWILSIQTE